MKNLSTEIIIPASKEEIWNKLTETKNYGEWNPFIKSIKGPLKQGEQIEVNLLNGEDKTMQFTPKILVAEENRELRWLGHLWMKGIFDGEHYFILEEIDSNTTRFIHGENFKGILASLFLKMIGKDTLNSFRAMNESLKAQF